MNRVTGSAWCLAALALATGCEPTGSPPKPKAGGEMVPRADKAGGMSTAPHHPEAVRADARAPRWVVDAAGPTPAAAAR